MDDSNLTRGTPVLCDPWVRAHTPTAEQEHNAAAAERKKRRSWFAGGSGTPVKVAPGSNVRGPSSEEEEEIATLQITHFTKKVMLSFDGVRLGRTKVKNLRLENPHDFPQEVAVEKFPFSKGFSLPDTQYELEARESLVVPISWTPTEEKNVRELVTLKCEGAFRLQLIILGTVSVPKKKRNVNRRSTYTARKGQALQARQNALAVTNLRRETFVHKKSPQPKPCQEVTDKENKVPNKGTKHADSPRSRKARARSVGTVLEQVLTPSHAFAGNQVERVIVGGKVCAFSPQLTAKALSEIAWQSPFADGKIRSTPQRETLTVCDGLSPLLQKKEERRREGEESCMRKVVLVKKAPADPIRRLSKEQMATVTKAKSPSSRLSDGRGAVPHRLTFADAEISHVEATPASSAQKIFGTDSQREECPLTSTRIDDSFCPSDRVMEEPVIGESSKEPSKGSMDRDSLEDEEPYQETAAIKTPSTPDNDVFVKDECSSAMVQEMTDNVKAGEQVEDEPELGSGTVDVEPIPEDTSLGVAVEAFKPEPENPNIPKSSPHESQKTELASISEPERKNRSQVWHISLGNSKKIPAEGSHKIPSGSLSARETSSRSGQVARGRSPAATVKVPARKQESKPSPSSAPKRAAGAAARSSPKPGEDFTIHRSVVTSKLNRKRLSDPHGKTSPPKKSRPSPEHKTSLRKGATTASATAKGASLKKGTAKPGSSQLMNRTVALRKAAATGKEVPIKAAAKPARSKPRAPKAVKGVPMAKLQLIKPTRTALPRHPLPFAAKNIFYDERWMEKQDRAFTCWLNYILTPEVDTPKDPNKKVKIDAHLLCLEGASKVGPAPSKEDLSLRAYTARRRLNRLRRGACLLFQSEPIIRVMQKVEAEVEKGRIVVRSDKMLHADLGIKQELLNMILCYNPLWLRIGLETIYGELLPIQDNSDVYGISRFVVTRLLGNPDIAADYAHPTVPNLFGEGYAASLAQFTLKKFLMLVFFLDRAKLTRLIDHDPCLFCKDATLKSSRDILLEFSRKYLRGEGDITRHLSFLGYSVTHVQQPLDEFDFAVTKLAVDLRCGVRLARVVELLTHNWTLSRELRVPAISRLQKIHNIEVAFKSLRERGIDVEGGGLNERAIVDGHREKTLELLWRIIFHYQVGVMLNEKQLKEEIAFLTKNRRLRRQFDALKTGATQQRPSGPGADGPHLYFKSSQLMLLMDWCKAVCSFYGMQIENFTVSFCDGRALCLLVHHYHPALLPYECISQDTTLMHFQREEALDLNSSLDDFNGTWSQTFSPTTGKQTDHDKLLAHERQNFKLLYDKVAELGGVPMMVRSADMSNTIPDEKVVITYVSYLCARLLDLRQETRAVRTIQLAWRAHWLRKEQAAKILRESAATKIQTAVRAYLLRRRHQRVASSVLALQTASRGFLARRKAQKLREEREAEKQHRAASYIQAVARGFLVRRLVAKQRDAATLIQAAVRGHQSRMRMLRERQAIGLIQEWYRSLIKTRQARSKFLALRHATIRVQAMWRGVLARKLYKKMVAALKIQAVWRGYLQRRQYLKQRSVAVLLQSHFRGRQALTAYQKLRSMVTKMQLLYRAKLQGRVQHREYLALRSAALILQKHVRGQLARKHVTRVKSAILLQAAYRGYVERKQYCAIRRSVVRIQAQFKGYQARKSYREMQQAARVLQVRYRAVARGRRVQREFNLMRGAAITLQAAVRSHQAQARYSQLRCNVIKAQAVVRRHQARQAYRKLREVTIILQTQYRARLLGRKACREYNLARGAAITIQAAYRGKVARSKFLVMKQASIVLQTWFRSCVARRRYLRLRSAAVILQTRYRALCMGRQAVQDFYYTRGAVITLQAAFRGYMQRKAYLQDRSNIIHIQAMARGALVRNQYLKTQRATVVLQRRFRALVVARSVRSSFQATREAVVVLQAAYRGSVQRRVYQNQRSAAIRIQAALRRSINQKKYVQLKTAARVLQTRIRARQLGKRVFNEFASMRQSAIVLQSGFRGYMLRKKFLRLRSAAVVIQAAYRGKMQHNHYVKVLAAVGVIQTRFRAWKLMQDCREDYFIILGAVITIQAAYRGYTARRIIKQQHVAATVIQANYRCHLARSKYLTLCKATHVLQTRIRAHLLALKIRANYLRMREAAIKIQALTRGKSVRKRLAQRHRAAGTIQAAVRAHLVQKHYLSLRSAACVFQRRFRAVLLRNRICMEYNIMRGAAITLQASFRGHLQRKRLAQQHLSATRIQSAFRCFTARRHYLALCKAAQVLQTRFRARTLRKAVQLQYHVTRGAAITLQASFRGHLQRKRLAQQHLSATRIQSAFRCFTARRRYLALCKAAQVLQTRFRASTLGKAVQLQYHVTRGAAITLQTSFRGHLQRKRLAQQHLSATRIQSAFRCFITRRRYLALCKAAQVLQTRFRARTLGKAVQLQYHVTRGAAITLQASFRGHLQRKRLAQQHLSATRIQSAFRCFTARRRYLALCKAAQVLQTRFRARTLGQAVQLQYHVTRGAAITLQASFRGHLQRKRLAEQHLSATRIQAAFRCFIARRRYLALCKAAQVLQTRFRARNLAKVVQLQYHVTRGAAITLQAALRGLVVRREIKRRQEAATKIQAAFKGCRERRRYQKTCNAILVVQRHVRAFRLGKEMQAEYQSLRHSAIRIQAHYRCHRERKRFGAKKAAAIKIQAAVRGYQSLMSTRRMKEERVNAALAFQRRWRAKVLRDREVVSYHLHRGAVITVQAAARGYIARQHLKKQHRAATVIQSVYRTHKASQAFRRTLSAVKTIQDHIRAHLLAKQVQREYLQLKCAAVSVQAVFRGLIVRRQLECQHVSATKIQAFVRQLIARRRYTAMRCAALILQRRYRAKKCGQEQWLRYQLTRGACITLQAAVRGYLVRAHMKKWHGAATTIQRVYRGWRQVQEYQRTRSTLVQLQRQIRAYVVGKKTRTDYVAMKAAAVVLQSAFRGLSARRFVAKHRAARKIQAVYRMHTTRKNYLVQRGAAVTIQATFRMYAVKMTYHRTLLALSTIQKHAKGYLATKRTRSDYLQMRHSAILIQSHVRRHAAQGSYMRLRRAAICLQAHFRRMLSERMYRRKRTAAIVLQRRYRAVTAGRRTREQYYLTRGATITIQAAFRGYLQCCRYRQLRCHTIKLQALVRGAMARRHYSQMLTETRAALTIQRCIRAHQNRKIEEAKRQARLAELQQFAVCARAHLSAIRLQRAYRNLLLRRAFQQKMAAIVTIQNWMRAWLQRLAYLKLRTSTLVLQRAARRYLARKNAAATCLQSVARVWLARQHVKKMQSAAFMMQALWRGHRVRCSIKSKKVAQARARCRQANRNATEEKKLCNRAASALDYLLHYKQMSRILETLMNLEVVSRLSVVCCERLVEGGAVPVFYCLVRGCNRSVACMDVIRYVVRILFNLTKTDSTQRAVLCDTESVTTLMDLLQMCREKNRDIFCKICVILGKLLQDHTQATMILSNPKTLEKVQSLHKLVSRKQTLNERRIKAKTLNASATSTSFLAGSFSGRSSASLLTATPRKRRRILDTAGAGTGGGEWHIEDPLTAISFLKTMAERV
ncbi:abnormal spindle-like microcephaly-associated protein homolog [Diadema antillarum]|uniref:abnormal spindle-like microcephaly-associated protein homolog n=1 Tax=Diadema antillarum TaxID=105358 RepID=UPI003A83D1AE